MACASVPRHRRGHNAYGACAGDEHIFAQDGERERGVNRIAERIEDSRNVRSHMGAVAPDIAHRYRDVFGEGAGPIDANALRVGTQMPAAGEAITAQATDDMPLAAHDFPNAKIGN